MKGRIFSVNLYNCFYTRYKIISKRQWDLKLVLGFKERTVQFIFFSMMFLPSISINRKTMYFAKYHSKKNGADKGEQ